MPDQNGNTPLHYAAKYGHLDLCKHLIDSGSSVIAKNYQKQTPYDVAESHSVRQYLLPLQLQAERGGEVAVSQPPVYVSQPSASTVPAQFAPPAQQTVFPTFGNSQQLPTTNTSYSAAPTNANVPAPYCPPTYPYTQLQNSKPSTSGGTTRLIQPGKKSDLLLLGHTIDEYNF